MKQLLPWLLFFPAMLVPACGVARAQDAQAKIDWPPKPGGELPRFDKPMTRA